MRKRIAGLLALLACALAAVTLAPATADARTYSGTCGTVDWSLDSDTGELHFKPTSGTEGTLASNTSNRYNFWPWYQYRSDVKSITSEGAIHATGNLSYAFSGCSGLTDISGLARWDTSSVTNMRYMFSNCYGLTSLPMENWDTPKVTSVTNMFSGCYSLSSVTLGPKVTANVIGQLPWPSSVKPYTGKWVRDDGLAGPYTTSELASAWEPSMAGTWVWETAAYTVSFDPNGGVGSMAPVKASPDITMPVSTFRYVGHEFVGWNTKADGTGQALIVGATLTPTEDTTLYAQWKDMPGSVSDSEFDVTTHGNEQVTIEGLPSGASYEVTETPLPSGWTLVRQRNTTGVIVPGVS